MKRREYEAIRGMFFRPAVTPIELDSIRSFAAAVASGDDGAERAMRRAMHAGANAALTALILGGDLVVEDDVPVPGVREGVN